MYILSREEMYACDKYTIETMGTPGKVLMENAGRGCAEHIIREILKKPGKVLIFCGSGNNGGDGFVIGRYLARQDYQVSIILTGKVEKMSSETRENYEECLNLKIPVNNSLGICDWQELEIQVESYDLVVDAIFGVGMKGELRGWLTELIAEINQKSKKTVAIDIPSGVDAENGRTGIAIEASETLTMAAIKYGIILDAGKYHSGKITVIDIGMPEKAILKHSPPGKLISEQEIILPERKSCYHKGNYGRIAIIAGSEGFSGAAVLACRAALRSGAGLITLFHPRGLETIFEIQLTEVMTHILPDSEEELLEQLSAFDAVLFGPGVGRGNRQRQILAALLHNWRKPMIIDADGLNLLSANPGLLKEIKQKDILLTPHIGEFARLSGFGVEEVLSNRIGILVDFCRSYQAKVLLKSSTTVCSDGEDLLFDTSGNDGLATGGSGDVLSGIVVSFIGQGMDVKQAGISASIVLGKTAEKVAKQRQTRSMIPSDIIDNLFKY